MVDPNQVGLLHVRGLLDGALLGLRAIEDPDLPLEGVRSFLSLALASVYEGCRDGVDFPTFREQTARALEFSREALAALQAVPVTDVNVERELGLVASAISALATNQLQPPVPGLRIPDGASRHAALRASVGEPRLHEIPRRTLHPTIPLRETDVIKLPEVATDLPSPIAIHSIEELQAYATSVQGGAKKEPVSSPPTVREPELDPIRGATDALLGVAVPQAQLIFDRGRGFFEDIATMSSMRKADEGDVWHELEPVERRMLARVDAIVVIGEWILPRLIQLLEDRPIPDPEMLWAALFVLGSLHGDDTRDQMVRLLEMTPLDDDDEMFDAIADVLSVVPHRGIEGVMRRWLENGDPYRVALAAHVLGRRRATMVETLLPLLGHDHPRVLEEAARALEQIPGDLREHDLRDVLRHPDPNVFAAAAECAVVRGFRGGLVEAEFRLKKPDPPEHAAILVALTSDESALELIFALAATEPTTVVYEALGWLGSIGIVPFLLGRLREGDAGAVIALQRLTGASLTDEEPIRDFEKDELPFARERFLAPPHEIVLSEDPEVWTAFWETYQRGANEKRRYRFGHEWSTEDNLYELSDMPATARSRRFAFLELCARTGGSFPFDPAAFVAPQRAQVQRWAEFLGAHTRAPRGRWTSRLAP